ncbi:UNVERIFIED_CONTAM: hypothetical protein PYX00_003472 [Menopon gallinae]|uniref:Uncharacterized protein n=1 Tax=Menopon gallinae TaxID=328185 RepID=A0AAW2I0E0_9NEOP
MTVITLIGVIALVASVSGQRYVEQDYQDIAAVGQPRQTYARAIAPTPRYSAQAVQPRPTPVPILKQINRHNDDGSYTYGYEGADGSFKIETKLPTGEVMGKYGYVDDTGKLRVIDYGANRYGFQPAGEGITVAPPTLVDETTKDGRASFADYDEESVYTPQPRVQRPQKRPEIFVQRAQPAPARAYTPFEQEIRATPAPAFEEVRFAATPAPRFAPSRRPSPVRYATPAPVAQVPQEVQQIPQQLQHIPQPVQQIPQQIQHIPQPVQQSPVPQRAVVPNAVPLFTPAQSPPPRPAPVREQYSSPASGILLDQLLKQYALPAGAGQPLHDITFGSYSSQTNY